MTFWHALVISLTAQPLVIAMGLSFLVNRFDPPEDTHG